MNKIIFLLIIFFLGCKSDISKCDQTGISVEPITLNRSDLPLKISFKVDSSLVAKKLERIEYESYKIIREYEGKNCKLSIYVISEYIKSDSLLKVEIQRRIKHNTNIESNGYFHSIQFGTIKGFWSEISKDTLQYKLFEGGNREQKLTIRVILKQVKNEISNECFEKIFKSIRIDSIKPLSMGVH
jgi:hypothetical protein